MSNPITFGYARVSTNSERQGSSLDEQRLRLLDAGCTEVFVETKSAKSAANRPVLQSLLSRIRPGDVVVATKIDRIARSTQDFLQLESSIRERGASLKFLDQPIDTSEPAGALLVTILASFAQFERSMTVQRVNEGLDRARREGVRLGRPPVDISTHPKAKALRTLVEQGTTVSEAAQTLGVARSTAHRWLAA